MNLAQRLKAGAVGVVHTAMTGLVHGVALLPFPALYLLSDVVAFFIHRVGRYRLAIVRKNLRGSFPEKSTRELRRIERQFYRNFADIFLEAVKLLHVSDREMRRRITFSGVENADRWLLQGRPVVAYFAHCGNWEWAPSITLWHSYQQGDKIRDCQIYRPLRNRWFNSLMLKIRSRFGSVSLPKRTAYLDLVRFARRGTATITGFMSDQKLSHGDPGHTVDFLNRPTPFITGTEILARKMDAAVVYFDIERTARGRYHLTVRPVTASPRELPEGALTERYAQLLSQTIRRDPSGWLWSHNRWKEPK